MRKQVLSLGIVALIAGFSGKVYSQNLIQQKITDEKGNPSLIVFAKNSNLTSATVQNVFKDILMLSTNDELRLIKTENDFSGKFVDEKYQQYLHGIKVEGGVYNLHYQNGKLVSMNGEIFQDENAQVTSTITPSSAFSLAVQSVGAEKYMWEDQDYIANNDYKKPSGELVYVPISQGFGKYSMMLAYKFDIYASLPLSRSHIFVDAIEGKIVAVDPIMKHADQHHKPELKMPVYVRPYNENKTEFPTLVLGSADTRYSGNKSIETTLSGSSYILSDTTRGNGIRTYNMQKGTTLSSAVDFTDADNNWTSAEFDNANYDNAALDAHWGVEKTYDYFMQKFNRNSFDNNGTLLRSYVHYRTAYENAGWTGSEMVYGDGATNFKPLTAFDVTAHELGHGVCSSSAALLYQRESGALNEALSDIWGAAAEYTYAPEKSIWLIGEDITKASPMYLRSMSNPNSGLNQQPDTYRGTYWYPATVEEGCVTPSSILNDNCGVHYNSGVINFWFYLLSVGGSGTNDLGKAYNVTGISIEKAAKIAYRLETAYLTANSNFMDARNYGIQAAKDLYGADTAEAIATQDAFYAVGLGPKYLSTPDTTPPTIPTNLAASNTTGSQTKLTWNPSTDDNDLDKYLIFRDGVQIGSVAPNVTTYIATGLSPNTTYHFYVKAQDAYENISSESNIVEVTTLDIPNYCISSGDNTADERIKRVQFGSIDNTSTSTAGYEDFSYISTEVDKTSSYQITITPEWPGNQYNEGYAVYVDWNNDGDFTDTGETAFTKTASQTNPVIGTITIPNVDRVGTVRMRVILRYSTVPTACNTYNYGQTEDYTLILKDASLAVSDVNTTKTAIYPNPVKDVLNIQSKQSTEFTYKIINSLGQVVSSGKSVDKKINTQKLSTGNYIIELNDKNGSISSIKFIKN